MKFNFFKSKIALVLLGVSLFLLITGVLVGQDSTAVEGSMKVVEKAAEVATPTLEVAEQVQSDGFSLMSLLRGILGLMTVLGIAYLFSSNRKKVNLRTVFGGLALQAGKRQKIITPKTHF